MTEETDMIQQVMGADFTKVSNTARVNARKFLKPLTSRGIDFSITKKDGLKIYIKFDKNKPFGMQLGILELYPFLPKNTKGHKVIEVIKEDGIVYLEITAEQGTHIYNGTDILDFKNFCEALIYLYKEFSV